MGRGPRNLRNGIWLAAMLLACDGFPAASGACLIYDFGDAPSSYGTLRADGGAKHRVDWEIFLGASIDREHDGQPSAGADGDDLAWSDDEDGIAFTSVVDAGEQATLDAIASAAGLLNAWIDFNADGDWDDAGEQIFSDLALAAGANSLSLAVPGGAIPGDTYARFRFNTSGGLSPYGWACNGEVEDYLVSIVSTPEPTTAVLMALGLTGLAYQGRRRTD